jgi:predicted transcriptional regulator
MTKRRNRVAIALSILSVCSGSANRTKIAHRANLNYLILRPYLEILKKNGLLEEIPKGSGFIYRTTPKGLEWIKRFKQSVTLLEEIEVAA